MVMNSPLLLTTEIKSGASAMRAAINILHNCVVGVHVRDFNAVYLRRNYEEYGTSLVFREWLTTSIPMGFGLVFMSI